MPSVTARAKGKTAVTALVKFNGHLVDSARVRSRTTVSAYLHGAYVGTPRFALADAGTDVRALVSLDGAYYDSADVLAGTTVSVYAHGEMNVSPELVDAGTDVRVAVIAAYLLGDFQIVVDGSTQVFVRDTPDMSDNEPITLAATLSGSYLAGYDEGT